jgi:Protein of unknown function (DUF2505)
VKFKIENEFPTKAENLWEYTLCDDYIENIRRVMNLKVYEMLDRKRTGDVETITMRMVPQAQVPKVVNKLLGGKEFETRDTFVRHHDTMSLEWSNTNNLSSSDRTSSKGRMQLTNVGKNKSKRIIEGDIQVNIPLIGKQVEKFVIGQLTERYKVQADYLTSWAKKQK